MKQLTKRQFRILEYIRKHKRVNNQEIRKYLQKEFGDISRITIIRDLNKLLKKGLIARQGRGRSVYYQELVKSEILRYFNVNEYFKQGPDERGVAFKRFNFEIFKNLKEVFTDQEMQQLKRLNKDYRKRVEKMSPTNLKKELERLTIELSWKSSRIEGNTYSLIDTEILIKENKQAEGHKEEEAIMILNHKKALDYILDKRNDFKKISLRKIENIHRRLIQGLKMSHGIRKKPVGVVGTSYKPLDNQHQIREEVERTVKAVNGLKAPFSKALIALAMISYIQPFEDGNKRTSRLLANALLLAYKICPLSFRSLDEADYKKAIILFYEQNSIRLLKELFIQQFQFAVENYF